MIVVSTPQFKCYKPYKMPLPENRWGLKNVNQQKTEHQTDPNKKQAYASMPPADTFR